MMFLSSFFGTGFKWLFYVNLLEGKLILWGQPPLTIQQAAFSEDEDEAVDKGQNAVHDEKAFRLEAGANGRDGGNGGPVTCPCSQSFLFTSKYDGLMPGDRINHGIQQVAA